MEVQELDDPSSTAQPDRYLVPNSKSDASTPQDRPLPIFARKDHTKRSDTFDWQQCATGTGESSAVLMNTSDQHDGFPFQAPPGTTEPLPMTTGLGDTDGVTESSRQKPSAGPVSETASPVSPAQRRNVSFAMTRSDVDDATSSPQRLPPPDVIEGIGEGRFRDRQASFFTKLKSLKPQHSRSPSGVGSAAAASPQSDQNESQYHLEPSEAADADVEDDSEENFTDGEARTRKKRKSKRPVLREVDSAPTTPRQSRFAAFIRDHPIPGSSRPSAPDRRNTSDMSDRGMAGVSEDEGRDRLRNAWRRGVEGAKGLGQSKNKGQDDGEATDTGKRPSHLRRLTGIGDGSPSAFRIRAERQATSTAQKWRQVKAGLKMLGQKRREERMRIDYQKSTQLIAELLAGTPSALIFASVFQRDEHGNRKVSVLLEQLKIRIPHIDTKDDSRNPIFHIDLEYGNGPARLRWTIQRALKDFITLHFKYRSRLTADKVRHLQGEDKTRPKIPKFPKSAFPYARTVRGLFAPIDDEEEDEETQTADAGNGSSAEVVESPGHKRRKSSIAYPLRANGTEGSASNANPEELSARQREAYHERQRQKMEVYLQQLIRWLIFRPESNRLCKFLELSALAVRLSSEGGFQGKQGLMNIASRQNREIRHKAIGPAAFKERHKTRWFLVRHSYVICVDGPESLNPYDVFLVDSDFRMTKKKGNINDKTATELPDASKDVTKPRTNKHMIRLYNGERKLKLIARSERQHFQFQESLNQMMATTIWAKKQRFGSFAPVRTNVWARWLVDGRDYMWQVSRAIDHAKDFVYIHDWWLSPELYLRRPPAISQKWRLDRLLQRKAQEGVKIFVIVYRNIESAIPIDSEYTKWSLLDLHENICIQRSPNQFRQNQFFWAHHEKLVVVDNVMAFCGGMDLCFGRWDDPSHPVTDDKLTGFELESAVPRNSEYCQLWAGKDYSNPRVQDFYALDRPYEEMYDRTRVPRMPWHDIGMQMAGQPARDLGRHFVQRWNYILRSRIPSRPTPVLIPPPEFEEQELDRLGMSGTCQIQMLRSSGQWSTGTSKTESSIATAYCHLIKHSDHFVYIENQFYVSSCTVEGTVIHNKIGDAITERAIQAHQNNENWRACLLIPLMPGFQSAVDSPDGTSIRLIMQCQYRSICRGETSIFGRLRAQGIDPTRYVQFYSLRQWGRIGPGNCLTTEQLYIHAKCMVVDDRTCIIGSANINERSLLGNRDSEIAAVITDTKMITSTMGGKPYMVGDFAHTLRMRLMREHLGIDTDVIYRRQQTTSTGAKSDAWPRESNETMDEDPSIIPTTDVPSHGSENAALAQKDVKDAAVTNTDQLPEPSKVGEETEITHELDVEGYGFDNMKALDATRDKGLTDTVVDSDGREILANSQSPAIHDIEVLNAKVKQDERSQSSPAQPPWPSQRGDTYTLGLAPRSQLPGLPILDDTDIGGPTARNISGSSSRTVRADLKICQAQVTEDCMTDPISSTFWDDVWHRVAENNTKIYRQVFRCMPDNEVTDWKTYEKYNDYNERFMQSQGLGRTKPETPQGVPPPQSGPVGSQRATEAATEVVSALKDEASLAEQRKKEGLLGGVFKRLRPASRASDAPTTLSSIELAQEEKEKNSSGDAVTADVRTHTQAEGIVAENEKFDEKEAADLAEGSNEGNGLHGVTSLRSLSGNTNLEEVRSQVKAVTYSKAINSAPETTATQSTPLQPSGSLNRRRRGTTKSSGRLTNVASTGPVEELLGRDEAESLLNQVQGNLVVWPYDWLEKEERGGNWLYNIDQLAPLEIYD